MWLLFLPSPFSADLAVCPLCEILCTTQYAADSRSFNVFPSRLLSVGYRRVADPCFWRAECIKACGQKIIREGIPGSHEYCNCNKNDCPNPGPEGAIRDHQGRNSGSC